MNVHEIKLEELVPAEYNPRQMSSQEQKKLENNLKKFGLVDPIIINLKNNHIIGGHQRYNALSKLKKDETFTLIELGDIGWVFEEASFSIPDDNHEKALNIALNKISGEWDYDKLISLFGEIKSSDFDIRLTGFDEIELSSFNIDETVYLDESIFASENKFPEKAEKRSEDDIVLGEPTPSNGEGDEEVLVNEGEIKRFRCPKCGHEW